MLSLYLPGDALTSSQPDVQIAADFLELSAFFSEGCEVNIPSEISNVIDISVEEDEQEQEFIDIEFQDQDVEHGHTGLDADMQEGEDTKVDDVVACLKERLRVLKETSYPFRLSEDGNIITYVGAAPISNAYAAYILSLMLSHLKSELIVDADFLSAEEVRQLREYFQYFATTALAAEIRGNAWSFGFPRTDGTSFLKKLRLIWEEFNDGRVEPQVGAPESPKDDQIDVFAARLHPDKLPGFLLATAQVATGMDFKGKSLKGHVTAFKQRWFTKEPLTDFIPYMIIPFMRSDSQFIDDVRVCGNVLHRLRVPRLVAEAGMMDDDGGKIDDRIENYEELERAAAWLVEFRARCLAEER